MTTIRICCWNMRRASRDSPAWELFSRIGPDIALLQEVGGIPVPLADQYDVVMRSAAGKRRAQRFSTAILARGTIHAPIALSSQWDWVNRELERFAGNLVAYAVSVRGREYRVLSAYIPAWPVDQVRLRGVDVEQVKLAQNPDVWVTELLWAALLNARDDDAQVPWIVGGDLNASETFDDMWVGGPRGNREVLDRMERLGLKECLREWNGRLVPTFRNARDGRLVHQVDHLFVSKTLALRLIACNVAEPARVLGESLSDHLPIVAEFSE